MSLLGATKHLYNWLCPSVGWSVGLLVGRVTHPFDDLHVAPYWPTWPCFICLCLIPFSTLIEISGAITSFRLSSPFSPSVSIFPVISNLYSIPTLLLLYLYFLCFFTRFFCRLSPCCLNKAGNTATPVACGWSGAIIEVSGTFGQEQ